MTKSRLLNGEYCVFQGLFWMAFCSVVSYAALFLQRHPSLRVEIGEEHVLLPQVFPGQGKGRVPQGLQTGIAAGKMSDT